MLALFQSNSINSEIMCESARTELLTNYLKEKNDNHASLLTAIAVVAVGGFALAKQSISEDSSGIIGGFLPSTFGSAAIFQGASYSFHRSRNLFERSGKIRRATLFPDVIRHFLNRPLEEDPSNTVRTSIIAHCRRDVRLRRLGLVVEERQMGIFFGEGGDYNEKDLRAQAEMFNMASHVQG